MDRKAQIMLRLHEIDKEIESLFEIKASPVSKKSASVLGFDFAHSRVRSQEIPRWHCMSVL